MDNLLNMVNIIMFLLFSLLTLWLTSTFILQSGKIRQFAPFFIIGVSFAYFGAFILFQIYSGPGWLVAKAMEVVAFVMIFIQIKKTKYHD